MPKLIPVADMPTPTRTSGPGKYDQICQDLVNLVTDAKIRDKQGIVFDKADGVILADSPDGKEKSNVGQVCQTLRVAAKAVGAKVKLVIREEGLYASYNGEFVEMTDAQKRQRQEAREANAAARNMKANTEAKQAAKAS
jgi:hypothetical protein